MESELARRQAPFRKRVAAARRWGSGPPLSAHGWRTGRVAGSGLDPGGRAGAGGRDLRYPLATTQLVDGACLIRRYRAVRFRGGQPWRDSSVGSERRAHNAEVVSSMLTLATAGRWPSVRLRKSCDRACRRSARRLAATTPVPVLSHAGFLSGWRGLGPGAEVFPA